MYTYIYDVSYITQFPFGVWIQLLDVLNPTIVKIHDGIPLFEFHLGFHGRIDMTHFWSWLWHDRLPDVTTSSPLDTHGYINYFDDITTQFIDAYMSPKTPLCITGHRM